MRSGYSAASAPAGTTAAVLDWLIMLLNNQNTILFAVKLCHAIHEPKNLFSEM